MKLDTVSSHASGRKYAVNMGEAGAIFRKNYIQTISYWAAFLIFGMCVAVLGPTLLDLGCITKSTITEMSWVIFAQTGCTLLGSVSAGYFCNKLNPNVILLWSTIIISITMAIVPLCHTRKQLLADFVVMGLFMGQIDTVANVRLIQIYGNCVAPFLQALHFAYGLGAFLSPVIAEPFLNNEDCTGIIHDLENKNATRHESKELEDAAQASRVGSAYSLYSIVQIPASLLLIAVIILDSDCYEKAKKSARNKKTKYEDLDETNSTRCTDSQSTDVVSSNFDSENVPGRKPSGSQHGPECINNIPPWIYYSVIAMIGLVLFFADAAQAAYGGYIYSYSARNEKITMSTTTGAYLTASFWGSFALGRLLSIPLSTLISSPVMLFINLCGSGMAMVLFFMFRESVPIIFVSTSLFGLFLSSIYPSGISMAEEYCSISSFMTSVLVMLAAAGEMCTPLLVGWLFDVIGPVALIFYELAASILGLILLLLAVVVAFQFISKHDASKHSPSVYSMCPCWQSMCLFPKNDGLTEPINPRRPPELVTQQIGSTNKEVITSTAPSAETGDGVKSYSSINK
ncbi:major facilitator superfamily domain-containing protein 4A-like [Symsagittifera roscoffensis]|uniref:major facilitator superfamily domain-containing protein 4A-like n=1 Tax=Symsagittifera roscoffensis TaxID=84072 RepID=UPI00307B2F5A